MDIIKGQNLRIKLGAKYVAFATDCTIHVGVSLENSSTKDDQDGLWAKQEVTGMAWDFSANALYSVQSDASGHNAEDALDIVLARQKVWVEFNRVEGAQNRSEVTSSNKYCGWAYVNDISVNATNRTNANYSIQGTGDGKLEKNGEQPSVSDI